MSKCRYTVSRIAAAALTISLGTGVLGQSEDRMILVSTYPNAAPGEVSSLRVNVDGSLTLVDTVATSDTGPQAVSLTPDGRFLAVSHGTAKSFENVDIIEVAANGTMTRVLTIGVPGGIL